MKWPFGKVVLPCFLVVAPVIYVPMSPDSSETSIRFGAGRGTYSAITTDCDGNVVQRGEGESEYVSGTLEHRFPGQKIKMGVHGVYSEQDTVDRFAEDYQNNIRIPFNRVRNRMLSPYIDLADDWAGVRLGAVLLEQPLVWGGDQLVFESRVAPTIMARVGDGNRNYVTAAFMDIENLNTFGIAYGLMTVRPNPQVEVAAGLSLLGPHRNLGYIGKGTLHASNNFSFGIAARIAPDGKTSNQTAFSLGINYQIRH